LRFFYKDAYGNLSQDDKLNKSNYKSVYGDYGIPDLAQQSVVMNLDFGFALASDQPGTDDSPHIFASGIEISESNQSQYVLRFSAPEYCRHTNNSVEDGPQSSDDQGHLIGSFALTVDGETNDFVSCGVSDDAEFYLVVEDRAGHRSQPYTYTLKSCSSPGPHTVCWKP
jgi:hypothetical protein